MRQVATGEVGVVRAEARRSAFGAVNRYRWDRHRISLGAFPQQHHLRDKTLIREDAMHQETIRMPRARACKTIGRVLTVLDSNAENRRPEESSNSGKDQAARRSTTC